MEISYIMKFSVMTWKEREAARSNIRSRNLSKRVFEYADQQHKPVTAENIKSIQRKKFYDKHRKRHRHISMFASALYSRELLISKAVKHHIGVKFVHPAYTSKVGKMRYLRRYGLTVHEAAALCIARRGQGYKESIPSYLKPYLTNKKVRALIPQQWGSLTKLINKVTESCRMAAEPVPVPPVQHLPFRS